MSLINTLPIRDYNNLFNNIKLYSTEYSNNTIGTEFELVNNSTNINLRTPVMGREEEDNISTNYSNNLNNLNNWNSMEDNR